MIITRNDNNGEVTLKLEGWLDHDGAAELGEAIDGVKEVQKLVLDFDGVEYMSSVGIRQIVAAHRATKAMGALFSVINVNSDVMSIFEMTRLNDKISITAKES